MLKNVSGQFVGVQMVSTTDGSAFSGTVTVYVTVDNGTQTLGAVGSGVCTHKGNGLHNYAPSQAETNGNSIQFTFIGTGAVPQTIQFETLPTTGVLAPTTANRTLDVSAGGEAGIDWANVGSPTTTLNLSGTTIATTQAVASVSGAVGSVTGSVGSVVGNVGGSVASVAGAVGSVTGSVGYVVAAVELDSAVETQIDNIENASGYLLAVLAGACADPQTASETYAITVFGSTFTVDMAGQTSAGVRTASTLTKV